MEHLISAYHSFNGLEVEELQTEPSPLEFMRFVSKNRPFVVRGAILQWPASHWSVASLEQTLGDGVVNIAVTPHGSVGLLRFQSIVHKAYLYRNADSVINCPTGKYFVKPFEEKTQFSSFIRFIQKQELGGIGQGQGHERVFCVRYAQSRMIVLRLGPLKLEYKLLTSIQRMIT